jgi:hypothetical protein
VHAPAPPAPLSTASPAPAPAVASRVAVPALLVAATAPPAAPLPATVALPGGDGSRAYVVRVDATTISVEHIDWAVLMKRTFGFDVLTCNHHGPGDDPQDPPAPLRAGRPAGSRTRARPHLEPPTDLGFEAA